MQEREAAMRRTCERLGLPFVDTPLDSTVGVADDLGAGALPLNGLRHGIGQTSGWFLFVGPEPGEAEDFFKPLHAVHLADRCPEVIPYLGLPPGWRFQIAPGHEDVWEDPALRDHEV